MKHCPCPLKGSGVINAPHPCIHLQSMLGCTLEQPQHRFCRALPEDEGTHQHRHGTPDLQAAPGNERPHLLDPCVPLLQPPTTSTRS